MIEALLGICYPERKRDLDFRDRFGKRWGLVPTDFRELHAKLERLIRVVAKVVQIAHHHPCIIGTGCPMDATAMKRSQFPLQATLLVLDEIVEPADLTTLATEHCAVCALSKDLTGSEVGLATPDLEAKLDYMVGGSAITSTVLGSAPPGPEPGIIMDPPALVPGDTRLAERTQAAEIWCDGCKRGPWGHNHGTWVNDRVRELLAKNRKEAYRAGSCCKWLCSRCWIQRIDAEGGSVPEGRTFTKRLLAWKAEVAEEERLEAVKRLAQAPGYKQTLLLGLCKATQPKTRATRLSDLLLAPHGQWDPAQCGTSLPASKTQEDRLGGQAHATKRYEAKCEGCPEATPIFTWDCAGPAPGTFVWKAHKQEGSQVPGLPPFSSWVEEWQEGRWNVAWYCLDCCLYIFDIAPGDLKAILARDSPSVYPVAPGKRAKRQQSPGPRSLAAPAPGGAPEADAGRLDSADTNTKGALTKPREVAGSNPQSRQDRGHEAVKFAWSRQGGRQAERGTGADRSPSGKRSRGSEESGSPPGTPGGHKGARAAKGPSRGSAGPAGSAPASSPSPVSSDFAWQPQLRLANLPKFLTSRSILRVEFDELEALLWFARQSYGPAPNDAWTSFCRKDGQPLAPRLHGPGTFRTFLLSLWPLGLCTKAGRGVPLSLPGWSWQVAEPQVPLAALVAWLIGPGSRHFAAKGVDVRAKWSEWEGARKEWVLALPAWAGREAPLTFAQAAGAKICQQYQFCTQSYAIQIVAVPADLPPFGRPASPPEEVGDWEVTKSSAAAGGVRPLPRLEPTQLPACPALGCRLTTELEAALDTSPQKNRRNMVRKCIEHVLIDHFRSLDPLCEDAYRQWVFEKLDKPGHWAETPRLNPNTWTSQEQACCLGEMYGGTIPDDGYPDWAAPWDGRRAALASVVNYLQGKEATSTAWKKFLESEGTHMRGHDPQRHTRDTVEEFLCSQGILEMGDPRLERLQSAWLDGQPAGRPSGSVGGQAASPPPDSTQSGDEGGEAGAARSPLSPKEEPVASPAADWDRDPSPPLPDPFPDAAGPGGAPQAGGSATVPPWREASAARPTAAAGAPRARDGDALPQQPGSIVPTTPPLLRRDASNRDRWVDWSQWDQPDQWQRRGSAWDAGRDASAGRGQGPDRDGERDRGWGQDSGAGQGSQDAWRAWRGSAGSQPSAAPLRDGRTANSPLGNAGHHGRRDALQDRPAAHHLGVPQRNRRGSHPAPHGLPGCQPHRRVEGLLRGLRLGAPRPS